MLLNTGHLADLFNISPSTVKKYSGIYGRFLSESARPHDGAHRLFDTEDVRVLAYVVQQTKLGEKHDNIIMSIANGARADVPTQYNDYSLTMDKGEQIMLLQNRIAQLEARVLELENEREARIRAEAERDLLRELLREAMGK
jgi:DNA-binding transcriptional MerR regulator